MHDCTDCFALSWRQKPAELVSSCGLCSSFMNINKDTRRPTELIKTQGRYYSSTAGRLRFLVPSSRKSAIPGSHQSSSFLMYLLLHTGRVVAKPQNTIQQSFSSHRLTTRIHLCWLRIYRIVDRRLCHELFSVSSKLMTTLLWYEKKKITLTLLLLLSKHLMIIKRHIRPSLPVW